MKGKVVVQARARVPADRASGSSTGSDDSGAVSGEETSSATIAPACPSTGAETLLDPLLGAATLGLGLLLRRRRET